MGGCVIKAGDRHIVRQLRVDEKTLDRVAEVLGISQQDRAQFISGAESIVIYRGPRQPQSRPKTPQKE